MWYSGVGKEVQKMGKNRTIPFGYMMKNGSITTDPAEVLAVLNIFSEYMAGKSLIGEWERRFATLFHTIFTLLCRVA